eukprot:5122823-Pleurochrysis_carterae.AAC.1
MHREPGAASPQAASETDQTPSYRCVRVRQGSNRHRHRHYQPLGVAHARRRRSCSPTLRERTQA